MPLETPWSKHPWQRALVYGLGLSGRAAARLLHERGVEVWAADARPAEALELEGLGGSGFEVHAGEEPRELPAGLDGVVVSPGIPADRPLLREACEAGLPIVGEIELAFAFAEGEVVAITGSNGKSTTTALTGALLEGAGRTVEVCGNIGRPFSECVEGPPGRTFVVEVSSFQLESVDRFRPRAAALLNLSADHLDRHRDLESYRAAKLRIFERQRGGDVTVLNADDAHVADAPSAARRRWFSLEGPVADGCFVDGERVLETRGGEVVLELFRTTDVVLHGRHNVENAMAAALLARALGVGADRIPAALRAFRGLPHRLEKVREKDSVAYYDDSKGTNVAATARSLEGFGDGQVHLILGGRNKGADLGALREIVARKARGVYLIGEASGDFAEALRGAVAITHCETLEKAVEAAAERAAAGEVVVLSPACASFDQFRDYRERGERFQVLVGALDGEKVQEEAGHGA